MTGSKGDVDPNYLKPSRPLEAQNAAAALIVVEGGRYLMQLRDNRPDIYYPGYWGLFGGALDIDEEPLDALRRELREELSLNVGEVNYFTRFDFDMSSVGRSWLFRIFYVVELSAAALQRLRLGEGKSMRVFDPAALLNLEKVVPYDAFALWLHAHRVHLDPRAPPVGIS
jgi:8-oxo-dGTP pyrophosphatase MutT (NUDIX family)